MKPLHGEFKRLSKCRCCVSKYSKFKSGKKNNGNSSTRQRVKNFLKKMVD